MNSSFIDFPSVKGILEFLNVQPVMFVVAMIIVAILFVYSYFAFKVRLFLFILVIMLISFAVLYFGV